MRRYVVPRMVQIDEFTTWQDARLKHGFKPTQLSPRKRDISVFISVRYSSIRNRWVWKTFRVQGGQCFKPAPGPEKTRRGETAAVSPEPDAIIRRNFRNFFPQSFLLCLPMLLHSAYSIRIIPKKISHIRVSLRTIAYDSKKKLNLNCSSLFLGRRSGECLYLSNRVLGRRAVQVWAGSGSRFQKSAMSGSRPGLRKSEGLDPDAYLPSVESFPRRRRVWAMCGCRLDFVLASASPRVKPVLVRIESIKTHDKLADRVGGLRRDARRVVPRARRDVRPVLTELQKGTELLDLCAVDEFVVGLPAVPLFEVVPAPVDPLPRRRRVDPRGMLVEADPESVPRAWGDLFGHVCRKS